MDEYVGRCQGMCRGHYWEMGCVGLWVKHLEKRNSQGDLAYIESSKTELLVDKN